MEHPDRRFAYFLADRLGMTANELMDRMSGEELTEWQAYFAVLRVEMDIAKQKAQQEAKMRRNR